MLAGAIGISASSMFVKLAGADPASSALLRCLIALVVLLPLAGYELRRRGLMPARMIWCGLAAGAFLGADFMMWTASIFDVGAAIATVLVNVQVVAFPVLARLLDGTPISRRFVAACPVMLVGVLLASGALGGSLSSAHPVRGTLLGIAAGVAYGAFLYLNRLSGERSPGHSVTPIALATVGAAAIAAVVGPFTTGIQLSQPPAAWGWLTALALVGQVASWVLVGIGSPRLAPNKTSALLLLTPVLAVALALVVLREDPTAVQLVGCVVVVAAVWVANRRGAARGRGASGSVRGASGS
ncbi:DMT family transporter [Pseudonocardia acaciae]|uniref:DMT family transporter n=1 Tax=Pseudonocardia acaciae TaxID=551276 RepID=UPI000A86AB32|nr:DMT family transporter [Pseudonocardia acaciae]